jgi:transcriptional regulator with XRE-family HTH domain
MSEDTDKNRPSAKAVRELRTQLDLNQDQLAEATGLRRTEISSIENGRNHATSLRIVTFLASGLGLLKGKAPDTDTMRDILSGKIPLSKAKRLVSVGKPPETR